MSSDTNKLPKRLLILAIIYFVIAVAGLAMSSSILLWLLLALINIAVLGKQKAGLMMLKALGVAQLLLVSFVSLIWLNPSSLQQEPWFEILQQQTWLHQPLLLVAIIGLAIATLWVSFSHKVSHYCQPNINLNIMQ